MNEFDNFVNEREQALKRAENHIAELRKMETIDFAFGGMPVDEDKKIVQVKPRMSETERRIQAYLLFEYVSSILKIDMDIEKKAKRICELVKTYEETVLENEY